VNSGTRVLIAVVIILFLVMSGLLGGLQWFQSHSRSDPAEVQAIADTILLISLPSELLPVKGADLSEMNGLRLAAFEGTDARGRKTHFLMTAITSQNFDASKEFESGIDWEEDAYELLEKGVKEFLYQGNSVPGYFFRFTNSHGDKRNEFSAVLDSATGKIILSLNGPADTVGDEILQGLLKTVSAAP
jgi:hypothetical protein